MALIEGFRVQNYRALRDVTLGKLSNLQQASPLDPLTVVIGKNGTGKSTLFDAFGFISDCLNSDVESACDLHGRGGFERLRSIGSQEPIRFEIYYREAPQARPITYELALNLDPSGRPFVELEVLKQRRKGQSHGQPFPFLRLHHGQGFVWAGEDALEVEGEEDSIKRSVSLTDSRELGITTLGTLREHTRIKLFRDFLKGWYLSYFTPDAARSLPSAGPQRHLNLHGDNIGNVVQFMEREHGDRFTLILQRIAKKIPGIKNIDTKVTDDKRVLLRFNDGAFSDPFFSQQMSDGTLKIFAYLLMLEDPEPPPFICIEEPEMGFTISFWEHLPVSSALMLQARKMRLKCLLQRTNPILWTLFDRPKSGYWKKVRTDILPLNGPQASRWCAISSRKGFRWVAFGIATIWSENQMHIEFLIEDSSGATLMELLIPKIIGPYADPHTWRIIAYKGVGRTPPNLKPATEARKRIMLDQLPKILRGYANTPDINAVVVVVDSDRKDCRDFLNELKSVASESGLPDTLFRIAIEEIEAWYLGDPTAIRAAYPKAKQGLLLRYEQDSVCNTWELLADIVHTGGFKAVSKVGWPLPGDLKHEWARNIGEHMDIERNASPSFKKLVSGLRRLADI